MLHETEIPGTYTIRLPKLFEQMTDPDAVTILKWHIKEHGILQPNAPLLLCEACIGYIDIPAPPRSMMRSPLRIMRITRGEGATVYLNDLLIVLESDHSTANK